MTPPGGIPTTVVFVPAMDCPDEEREIRTALARIPSVESLTFRLFARQVVVTHRGPVEPVLDALRHIGMEGTPVDETLRKSTCRGRTSASGGRSCSPAPRCCSVSPCTRFSPEGRSPASPSSRRSS
jgi:hypothetical protein